MKYILLLVIGLIIGAAGAIFAGEILRAVAAGFGLGLVKSGAGGESNGLIALGMPAFVGPP